MESNLDTTLKHIKTLSIDELKLTYQTAIPSHLAPSVSYWDSHTGEQLAIGLRACLAIWAASNQKIVPLEFQLTATIALLSGQDTLLDVGTGYGQTLCMIIPCLLDSLPLFDFLWARISTKENSPCF